MREREMEGEKHSLRNWASKSKKVKVAQSRPTPCPVDCSLPGSSVHGILQATILEWVAMPFFRGSSLLRDLTHSLALQADSLPSKPPGNPLVIQL